MVSGRILGGERDHAHIAVHVANDAKATSGDWRPSQLMARPGSRAGSGEDHFAAVQSSADIADDDVTGCGTMRDVHECGDG